MDHMIEALKRKMKPNPEKVEKTLHEYKHGELHSGSKEGPVVHDKSQAVAIALNQAKKK